MARYDISILKHSKEPKPKLKTFVNLDGQKLGIEFDDQLENCRFFIYTKKKKDASDYSSWVSIYEDEKKIQDVLYAMIVNYYQDHDRLASDGNLPLYTRIELALPIAHLHFHAYAGTLEKVLAKEIIYN